ncbi:MAG TPA: Holliday junction resolvase RuvX [Candidatus Paceibacterota bacterium]|nr:Holliday junction resolvase RuvX [Candidatus Paceibacterota bacterium]
MKHLGIDYGTKRVGIALSDDAGVMGFPHAILPNDPLLLGSVKNLIERERVGAIVMGESLDFSGAENPVAKEAREFAKALEEETGLTVFYEPEMLTTQEARRDFEGIRTKGAVDSSAAALILTSFLDKQKNHDQLR